MTHRRTACLSILLCATMLLSACSANTTPPSTAAPAGEAASATPLPPTNTPLPPTATPTPLPTDTPTPTFTPTPALPVLFSTPVPFEPAPLTVENAASLVQIATWGRGPVREVALPADGAFIVAAFSSGIGVFDPQSLEQQLWIPSVVSGMDVSRDGKLIAGGGRDHLVHVWDAASGEELHTFKGHQDTVTSVVFLPDERLASGSLDKAVKIWSLAEDKALQTLEGHKQAVTEMTLSPDGARLASGDGAGHILLWNLEDGNKLFDTPGQSQYTYVNDLAFSPDGKLLASADGYEGTIRVLNAETGKGATRLNVAQQALVSVAFSPDGETLVGGTEKGLIQIWKGSGYQKRGSLEGHFADASHLAFTPDGARLVSGSFDESLRVWDMAAGEQAAVNLPALPWARGLSLLPDGQTLAYTSLDKHIYTINLKDGSPVDDFTFTTRGQVLNDPKLFSLEDRAADLTLSPDGKYFIPDLSYINFLNLYKMEDGELVHELTTGVAPQRNNPWDARFYTSAISADDKYVAGGDGYGKVYMWDLESGELLYTLQGHTASVYVVKFSPDSQLLASSDFRGMIRLWNTSDGSLVREISGHDEFINAMAFSPDGKLLASVSDDETIHITNVEDGSLLQSMDSHKAGETAVAFSPDGSLLVVGGYEGEIAIYDVANGEKLVELPGHSGRMQYFIFTPDSRYLLATGMDALTTIYGIMP